MSSVNYHISVISVNYYIMKKAFHKQKHGNSRSTDYGRKIEKRKLTKMSDIIR